MFARPLQSPNRRMRGERKNMTTAFRGAAPRFGCVGCFRCCTISLCFHVDFLQVRAVFPLLRVPEVLSPDLRLASASAAECRLSPGTLGADPHVAAAARCGASRGDRDPPGARPVHRSASHPSRR